MLFRTSNIAKNFGPVTFLLYGFFLLTWIYNLFQNSKAVSERIVHAFFPKHHKNFLTGCFFGHEVLQKLKGLKLFCYMT